MVRAQEKEQLLKKTLQKCKVFFYGLNSTPCYHGMTRILFQTPSCQLIWQKKTPTETPINFKKTPTNLKLKQMKINILFIINKHKKNAKGLCVLMCRLTFNKARKSFSTGLFIILQLELYPPWQHRRGRRTAR